MGNGKIGEAVESVEGYYRTRAKPGPQADIPATAVIEEGLRCRVASPDGRAIYTDMPTAIGGSASANSPGWHLRAALASCDATLLAMRAARVGIELDRVEVRVEASSDGRGMLLDNGVSPASSDMCVYFRIGAAAASREQIETLIAWVQQHSPVGNDVARALDVRSEIEML
jgi:uncharacterized OsmC-like protein